MYNVAYSMHYLDNIYTYQKQPMILKIEERLLHF